MSIVTNDTVKLLDEHQIAVSEHYSAHPWLNNTEQLARTIDWITFFRRNEELFIEYYFGLPLYEYQRYVLHELGTHQHSTLVMGRASAKTYMAGAHACAMCVLYPGLVVVVAASTKDQARIIVYEKIQRELMQRSAILCAEIENISTGKEDTHINFKNGSCIIVVVGDERARGHRCHLLILDEFRQMKKNVIDNTMIPFLINRQPMFTHIRGYEHLVDPPKDLMLSSNWFASHWMYEQMKRACVAYVQGENEAYFNTDYSICLRHGIKPIDTIVHAYKRSDLTTWQIEYCNYTIKENTKAYFTFKLLDDCRTLVNQFYPRKHEDVLSKVKNRYSIPRQEGEIRLVACDIAMVNRRGNDRSCFACIRLLPNADRTMDGEIVHSGYKRQLCYLEAKPGDETTKQALRIKQLYDDFDADYCVLDLRNAGVSVYDALARIQYDPERNIEYPPWTCINDDVIAARVPITGAMKNVYGIQASAKLNSEIAESLRKTLRNRDIELLVDFEAYSDEMRRKIPEYFETTDTDIQAFYEQPFFETVAMINETISLEYDTSPNTGIISVHEVGNATKDRYTAVSYGNYFADLLERDLLSNIQEYEYQVLVN